MELNVKPKKNFMIQAFLLLFVISKAQIGVGVLGYQRIIFMESGHDAWISVIVAGVMVHLSMWFIVKTLQQYESTDLLGIHYDLFGRWVGGLLNIFINLYYCIIVITIGRTYIETVQSWIMQDIPTWLLLLLLLILVLYGVLGGIRIIVGICVFGFTAGILTSFLFFFALKYAEWSFLQPVMEANASEILSGALKMGVTISGYEIIYFLYPFVGDKQYVQRYAQLGLLITNIIYLILMVVSLAYYSEGMILKKIWGTLGLMKIISFSFLERFEYVIIPFWMLVLISNMILTSWVFTRSVKRMFNISQKRVLYFFLGVIFVVTLCFQSREHVNLLNRWISNISVYVVLFYPPILFGIVKLVHSIRKRGAKG